ncbi:hypothetical protein MPLDJ20_220049 [Mesorhizobium plurifarium]|uniref:Uncharacterized protein n=1 Tax=Mesorhizobium plurifarium TaxID=69974 RepID=A0A090F2H6_MESPL|nr:hypothetical protein MPLDJ20_220049 [Mesorhizobium plurifarium]
MLDMTMLDRISVSALPPEIAITSSLTGRPNTLT